MPQAENKKLYPEYNKADFPAFEQDIARFWEEQDIFKKSISNRTDAPPFVFYEGPPSANGMPGIHHVMSRTIKDLFCRYKTLQGYKVDRKAGWDTHGLPIELQVEKSLGITKDDIGKKISVEDYNAACRRDVMKFKNVWDDLTRTIGYWVDLDHPYITYDNSYIETVWYLLKEMHTKGLLYKGYTIQPYSPAAGTGLSSHELNQPGTYREIKDTTVVAQFEIIDNDRKKEVFGKLTDLDPNLPVHILAWTTTPWTLPSNTALAVGPKISYSVVRSFNQYTFAPIQVVLATELVPRFFNAEDGQLALENYSAGDKKIPYRILGEFKGSNLVGLRYHQLLPYTLPCENPEQAFRVIPGDFVTTEDGTGIVHIAPTFGADDARVAKQAGVPAMLVLNSENKQVPLVDLQGKFVEQAGELAGKYVKNEYYPNPPEKSVDVEIAIKLKEENKAFRVEKYAHSYPHCWRTDKPILYYPLESWFIKTTAVKDQLIALNKTINWKPEHTGEGRFGNWLENLVDWNLSRSRFWGTPLPIWRTVDGTEELCIGSLDELKIHADKSIEKGFMKASDLESGHGLDLHRPYVDRIVFVSPMGKPMYRETDLIDVWFDSGAMPYAQWGLNKSGNGGPFAPGFEDAFPADFIAEGVDQTRGWFFTLHAISTLLFNKVAFKNVVANGLVLDKNGNKMSKRLGNTVDPFETVKTYGADATRWYLIGNAAPWDNLKFDMDGLAETQRKFFGTLYNTYAFFALYANLDGFTNYEKDRVPYNELTELDRWILSALNKLIRDVTTFMDDYEPHQAARAIQDFVGDHLSNWYVRLSRRRFWKSESSTDKRAAFETLQHCLVVVSQLMSPIAPFFADWLYRNMTSGVREQAIANQTPLRFESVHLTSLVKTDAEYIDEELLERMEMAQRICSMILAIRKKERIKVRQPLQKMLIPVLDKHFEDQIRSVSDLIQSEVNVKEIHYIHDGESSLIVKSARPDFKKIGPRAGAAMKDIAARIQSFSAADIRALETDGRITLNLPNGEFILERDEVEILTKDVEGWQVAVNGNLTVALDLGITPELYTEGLAREIVNKIQNLRKDSGLEVNDRINVRITPHPDIDSTLSVFKNYICGEILAGDIVLSENTGGEPTDINGIQVNITITKA